MRLQIGDGVGSGKKGEEIIRLSCLVFFILGCGVVSRPVSGVVTNVNFAYLLLSNTPVTNVTIIADDGSKYFGGFEESVSYLHTGDIVRVNLGVGNDYVSITNNTEIIKKQDGTIRLVQQKIYWMRIIEYKIIKRASNS